MDWIKFLTLALYLGSSSGCMVLDEMDAAAAKMTPQEKAADTKSAGPATKSELLESSKAWWDQATSLGPGEMKSSMVRCELRSGTQFMSQDDCTLRGGRSAKL